MDFPGVSQIKDIIAEIQALKRDVETLKAVITAIRQVLNERAGESIK